MAEISIEVGGVGGLLNVFDRTRNARNKKSPPAPKIIGILLVGGGGVPLAVHTPLYATMISMLREFSQTVSKTVRLRCVNKKAEYSHALTSYFSSSPFDASLLSRTERFRQTQHLRSFLVHKIFSVLKKYSD